MPGPSKNLLLSALSEGAFASLESHLTSVSLKVRDPLQVPGEPIEHVYFFEDAIGSKVARVGEEQIEVGITGREGMSGKELLLGTNRSPLEGFVQVPGEASRISADNLLRAIRDIDEIRVLLLRHAQAEAVQIAYTALANGRFTLVERMARWILMCHDRLASDEMQLTHEFLSLMLGVRRAGVTTEMHVLEGEHAIYNRRGLIIVRDRQKLEHLAGASYGVPEAEYERLIGQKLRRPNAGGRTSVYE